jgi:hypothetical protein
MITRFQQGVELLRQGDIEKLISVGAPNNEYDSEAAMITDRIGIAEGASPDGRVSKDQALSIIAGVWAEMFGLSERELALRREAFEAVAARIAC